jgi:hypothetical protein
MNVAGIEIEPAEGGPYFIASRGWVVYPYRISSATPVDRDELKRLIGQVVDGREVVGVESFAVQRQDGKEIGLVSRKTE